MGILTNMLANALLEANLMEMAESLDFFKKIVVAMTPQVIQNWCLVKWGSRTNNRALNHWKHELLSAITEVSSTKLTKMSDSKSDKAKLKVIEAHFDRNDIFTRYERVWFFSHKKLEHKEHIDHDVLVELCKEFNKDAEYVAKLMATFDYEATVKYINSL